MQSQMNKTKVAILTIAVIVIIVLAFLAGGSIIIPLDKDPTPPPTPTATPTPPSTRIPTPTPTPAPTPTLSYSVGISVHPPFSASDAQLVAESGANWVRIDVSPDFSNAVANAKGQNFKVLGILGSWMFDKSTVFSINDWQRNVTYYVSQNPNVDAWEIWNEPADTNYPLMTLNANNNLDQTVQNYYSMVQTASPIIRSYTQTAKIVLLGGLQLYSDNTQQNVDLQFANQLAETNLSSYGDVISVHAYTWNKNSQIIFEKYSQSLEKYTSLFPTKEVWITETGKTIEDSGEGGQAQYISDLLPFLQDKVSNVFWYSLHDNNDEVTRNPPQHFGLIGDNGIREAYFQMHKFITDR
jgi:hypothetical protein